LNSAKHKFYKWVKQELGTRICHFAAKIYRFHQFCTPSVSHFCIPSSSMVHCSDATVYMLKCEPMLKGWINPRWSTWTQW